MTMCIIGYCIFIAQSLNLEIANIAVTLLYYLLRLYRTNLDGIDNG